MDCLKLGTVCTTFTFIFVYLLDFSNIPCLMDHLNSNYEHWKVQCGSPSSSEAETEVCKNVSYFLLTLCETNVELQLR